MLELVTGLLVLLLLGGAVAGIVRWATVSPREDEVVIVAGEGSSDSHRHYDVVETGSRFVLPGFESATRMATAPFEIVFEVGGVYDANGDEHVLRGEIELEISQDPELLPRAVEHFLGQPADAVARAARTPVEQRAAEYLDHLAEKGFDEELETNLRERLEPNLEEYGLELLDLELELDRA